MSVYYSVVWHIFVVCVVLCYVFLSKFSIYSQDFHFYIIYIFFNSKFKMCFLENSFFLLTRILLLLNPCITYNASILCGLSFFFLKTAFTHGISGFASIFAAYIIQNIFQTGKKVFLFFFFYLSEFSFSLLGIRFFLSSLEAYFND